MYQKFIITNEGTLRFGQVYLHRDLLHYGEDCTYGGGLWKIDHSRNAILLYGRSFDFGLPDFSQVRHIDWSHFGNLHPILLYAPHWPNEDLLEPVYANNC